ncbi:MAG: DUF86 domain-containing protein [Cellulomonadaceae bacterium]|jgi:uncharacterized protein with HEPN domain|nr:DUF86 domain-containing protein [Cellulomonadaceae bacterium]
MHPKSLAHLYDAKHAATLAHSFVQDMTYESYLGDARTRAAVERMMLTLGEALARLRRDDPETANLIPGIVRIIGFRNRIVHVYDEIDDAVVWDAATIEVNNLIPVLDSLLPELPELVLP